MDIKITHSWLKEYLNTKATPEKIAKYVSLCGPSIERIHSVDKDFVYDIEVTSNRVDTASVIGIAREAATILPQFGIAALFTPPPSIMPKVKVVKPLPLSIKTDKKLNKRVMAVVLENVAQGDSPNWMKTRLEQAGVRSLNILVDITNYVMLEIGHPTHVFDYDAVANLTSGKTPSLRFRLSKRGEKITTLDNKTYVLPGNDIVIESGTGEIIDLPGIMGTKNSVVTKDTKRIIFFLDNNDPLLMRRTSLALGIRSLAVQLNEKSVDPELAQIAFIKGVTLYQQLAKATLASNIFDIYDQKPKAKIITTTLDFINSRLGVSLDAQKIGSILKTLGFMMTYKANSKEFHITPPSFRSVDVTRAEDIVEEVARIYGYFNLPSVLMEGKIPPHQSEVFDFERKLKQILKGFGGVEMYTTSLVSEKEAGESALRVKNPLGSDTQYLRTTLFYTSIRSAQQNLSETDPFFLFELANVYIPVKNDLPKENLTLALVFANFEYRNAKGIIEAFLEQLNIAAKFILTDNSLEAVITCDNKRIGSLRIVGKFYYVEFEFEQLKNYYKPFVTFKPLPKYPAQVEDLTVLVPQSLALGELLDYIKDIDNNISRVELKDVYKDAYTFRIWYQHKDKTLTDKEVTVLREKILKQLDKKYKIVVKN